jgi:hypothetical protein
MQTYATAVPEEMVVRLITVGQIDSSQGSRIKDSGAYSGINLAGWH